MPILKNIETGALEESAQIGPQHEVPLISPEGQFGSAPMDNAQELLQQGYRQPTKAELQHEQKLDVAATQPIAAGIEALGRGTLGPLSDQILVSAGVSPEEIRLRKEANPVISAVGEIGGLAGGAMRGTGLGGALEYVGAKAAAPIAAAVPGVAGRVGSTAANMAIQAAVQQGSDEVSKMVLQDPHQSMQTALTDIGLSAALGGALGAAGAGAAELWKIGPGKKIEAITEALKNRANGVQSEMKELAGIKLSPEIEAAISGNPAAKDAFQVLMESNTKAGKVTQEAFAKFKTDMSNALAESLGKTPEQLDELINLSKAEVGGQFQKTLAASIEEKYAPIAAKYEQIEEQFSKAMLTEADRVAVADAVGEMLPQLQKGPNKAAANLANELLSKLPEQQTVNDLRTYAQELSKMAPYGSDLYHTAKDLRKVLDDTIASALELNLSKTGGGAFASFKETQAAYREFKQLMDELNDRLRLGREGKRGAQSFIAALKSEEPEKVMRALSLKDDVKLQALLQQQFPEVAQIARKQELDLVLKNSLDKTGASVDINKFFKNVEKLEPELRNYLMDKSVQERVMALKDMYTSLPSKMNTSGTAKTLDKLWGHVPAGMAGMIAALTGHNPVLAAILGEAAHVAAKETPDAARLAFLRVLGSPEGTSAEGLASAIKAMGAISRGEHQLNKAVKAVFKAGAMVIPEPTSKERDRLQKQIDAYSADANKFMEVGGKVGHYMPDQQASLAETSMRVISYLSSLKPDTAPLGPLGQNRVPNAAEVAKYNRALNIAEQPAVVLNYIKEGTLTVEDVQHLRAMYPALAQRINEKLGQEMIDAAHAKAAIPYKTKVALSLFQGQPLDSSLQPQAIQAAQPMLPAQMLQQPVPGKPAKGSMSKINKLPSMSATPEQSRELRNATRHR